MASGTQLGTRLDLEPVGAIASPPPIHELPNDGYLRQREDSSPTGMDSVREWIGSESRREIRTESPSFRLPRIDQRVGRGSVEIAHAYPMASWDFEAERDRRGRHPTESRAHVVRRLASARTTLGTPRSKAHASQRILAGELERRPADVEAARARLEKRRVDGIATAPVEIRIVDDELIARGDSEPHCVPGDDLDEERCRRHDRSGESD